MSSAASPAEPKRSRIELVDVARGVALIAMAIYHFTWDLEFFGYLDPGATSQGVLRLYARCIATTFLTLVGISLVLAHGRGVRWRPFLIRLAQITVWAAAITAVTWAMGIRIAVSTTASAIIAVISYVPSNFIFFGILHEIALASLLGLAFLRLPALVTLAVAAVVIATPWFARSEFFDHPAWWWVGLSSVDPRSNDYVPVFPWFGPVLVGIALTKIAVAFGLVERLAPLRPAYTWPLQFIGRHSLAFYLIHQPLLIGCVWAFAQVFPPPAVPPAVEFRNACDAQCKAVRDEAFCARYCVCMLDELEREGMTDAIFTDEPSAELSAKLQGLASVCTERTDLEMEEEP